MKFSNRVISLGLLLGLPLGLLLGLGLGLYSQWGKGVWGPPSTPQNEESKLEALRHFYRGTLALAVNDPARAKAELQTVTEMLPREPAAWANLGLYYWGQGQEDSAQQLLHKAVQLAPTNADLHFLLAACEEKRGQGGVAIEQYRLALKQDPSQIKVRLALAKALAQLKDSLSHQEALQILIKLAQTQPQSLLIPTEGLQIALELGDSSALAQFAQNLENQKNFFSEAAKRARVQWQLNRLRPENGASAVANAFFRNAMVATPEYQQEQKQIGWVAEGLLGAPLSQLLTVTLPVPLVATPDSSLAFEWKNSEPVTQTKISQPSSKTQVQILYGERSPNPEIWIGNDSGLKAIGSTHDTVTYKVLTQDFGPIQRVFPLDVNNDGKLDHLVMAENKLGWVPSGSRTVLPLPIALEPNTTFPKNFLNHLEQGILFDAEADGDLDLALISREGYLRFLQNNGDGHFSPAFWLGQKNSRSEITAKQFLYGDIDADGDPDICLLTPDGKLRVYQNLRSGQYESLPFANSLKPLVAISFGALWGQGRFGILGLTPDGDVLELQWNGVEKKWDSVSVAQGHRFKDLKENQKVTLTLADLDNNGAEDILIGYEDSLQVLLQGSQHRFMALPTLKGFYFQGLADQDQDGRLDLLALDQDGQLKWGYNRSSKNYHWFSVQLSAGEAKGDGRINAQGLGSSVELRTGLSYQLKSMQQGVLHFGLGNAVEPDLMRVVWPNGTVQAEFGLKGNQTTLATQRLKGSCPFLFADNGEGMHFVTDLIWRSPLGLRINAQATASVLQTEDWVKVRGDQLTPKNGVYDLRITADLWETHFFDHVALQVVDHPAGTELAVDERFSFPPPAKGLQLLSTPLPVQAARDQAGRDVTALVAKRDGQYLGGFALGRFQGLAQDHWVELDLGPSQNPDQETLLAFGWIYPTDSSINKGLGQGQLPGLKDLSLEVRDKNGEWKIAVAHLGFPSGKLKTMLIPLKGLFKPGEERQVRLKTNMEVYWDAFSIAEQRDASLAKSTPASLLSANLHYRGFSRMHTEQRSAPDLPEYATRGREPSWRDLAGYYTRYGDIRELLEKVEDRYAILNAGDEIRLLFKAPPPPAAGFERDFVFVSDGWVKDGDYNTGFSQTVEPLPSHASPAYDQGYESLQADPVFQAHSGDWIKFHTRYVGTPDFASILQVRTHATPRPR